MSKRHWLELYSTKGAICPYCNAIHDPSDDNYDLYDEGTYEWECATCDKVFSVSVHISYSWQTEEVNDT